MSHIIHMYRPFLNGCSFDVMTHIWLKIKRRLSFGFGFDSPNKWLSAVTRSRCFLFLLQGRNEFYRILIWDTTINYNNNKSRILHVGILNGVFVS